jgi:hypothetical protein
MIFAIGILAIWTLTCIPPAVVVGRALRSGGTS